MVTPLHRQKGVRWEKQRDAKGAIVSVKIWARARYQVCYKCFFVFRCHPKSFVSKINKHTLKTEIVIYYSIKKYIIMKIDDCFCCQVLMFSSSWDLVV